MEQLMTHDEREFLEIMSVVGMITKPLHVRRLQKTLMVRAFAATFSAADMRSFMLNRTSSLQEYSSDRCKFLHSAVALVGWPPLQSLQPTFQALVAYQLGLPRKLFVITT